jgi:hypothetical protein
MGGNCENKDVNQIFNSFLNNYLSILMLVSLK